MERAALEGGFRSVPVEAAHVFRAALDAMARPGRIHKLCGATPPPPLSVAAGALLLTLTDGDTPLWFAPDLRRPAVEGWIQFHTGAPLTEKADSAAFAIGTWGDLAPITKFSIGEPEYPDRSATLIVLMDRLDAGPHATRLRGPGIETEARLALPEEKAFQDNHMLFPLGLDFFFCADDALAAVPRTTIVGG